MIRNLLLVCSAVLILIVVAVGLSDPLPRADLTYVNPSGIHTLDPARMSWTQDFRVAINLWEGLTALDPRTTEPIAGDAHFPPRISEDSLTYTFVVREDARWSNGNAVTPADFVRGWRRAMEPGTAMDYAFLFTDHIEGAAEYVAWRREAVAVVAAMRSLASGSTIDAESAEALSRSKAIERWHPKKDEAASSAPDDPRRWDRFVAELGDAVVDWSSVAADVLREHASQMDARFSQVGIRITGDALTVRLVRPCPYFLDLTALPAFLPCHESAERLRIRHDGLPLTPEGLVVYDSQWTKPDYHTNGYSGLVTNGPYRLQEWEFKRRARLAANPFHREYSALKCRTVDMLELGNVSTSLMSYEHGDVDFLTDLTVPYDHELYRMAQSGRRDDIRFCHVAATYFLNFNCLEKQADGSPNPFANPLVRKAFTLATDRARIVNRVLARGDRAAQSFVPPGLTANYSPPAGLAHSPSDALAALNEAGFASGRDLGAVDLLCTFNDERIAQAAAKMWEEALGVDVTIRSQESKTFAHEKAQHQFMIARGNWYADYGDPTTFLNCLKTGNGNNDSGYSSHKYDTLMQAAAETADGVVRARLLQEAETLILFDDCPILPMLHYTQMVAISPNVSGLYPNGRLWFPFRYAAVNR